MSRTVFTGAMVFEGTGTPFAQADLVVEDGRFVDVGSGLDGDDRVDLSGKHVIPGLFDCHVHVVGSHLDTMKYLETPLSYLFVESAKNLEITLRRGSARQAAIAQGSATPSVCWPLLIRIWRGRCAIRWRAIQMWKAPMSEQSVVSSSSKPCRTCTSRSG